MRPYVKEVETNLQGGGKYALGQRTLIVGRNRSGKSTLVRAIELATTGRASDIAGRDTLALDADLWTLAPAGAEVAEARVVFSDMTDASWTLTHGKKAKRTGQDARFPLRDVRTAVLGSVETARKFFTKVAGAASWAEVMQEVPPQFHERLAPYKSIDGTAGLVAAIEGTKKRARDLLGEAKAHRETAEMMTRGLPPPASPGEIERAKLALDTAGNVALARSLDDRIAVFEPLLRVECERAGVAQARVEAARRALAELPPTADPLPVLAEQALAVMEAVVNEGGSCCLICGSTVHPETFGYRLRKAKENVGARIISQKRREEALATLREAEFDLGVAQKDAGRHAEAHAALVAERQSLGEIEANDGEDYSALIRNAEKWGAARLSEGRANELEAESTIMKQATIVCQKALGRLLAKARAAFEAKVQAFLPPGWTFGIDLDDGEREVFRLGLREGKLLRTALCGAEWATVTAALAGASANGSVEPLIVVPEDRDFDPDTLGEVMATLGKIDGQVILTGTKAPTRPVNGWTVIDLNPEPKSMEELLR
jgi:hypothetical protein